MLFKVKNPGECPLRIAVHEKAPICSLKNIVYCISPMIFPVDCPLLSRTIIIEKAEEEEQEPGAGDEQ